MIKQEDSRKRGRAARNKGANAERELASIIREHGYDVHRGKVFYHESDVVGLPGIHVECKRVEHLNIEKAMQQAVEEADKRKDGAPAVFHRKDRGEWLVTLRIDDFFTLYRGEANGKKIIRNV